MNNQHSKIAGLNTYVGKTVPSFSSPKHCKNCVSGFILFQRRTPICIYFIFQSAAYHRVFFPKYQFVISICHLHSLHRSHCNIDFDRVVLISDFYARISKYGCLNKTRTFPITIFCISLTNIFSGLFHSDSNSVDCSEKQGNSE